MPGNDHIFPLYRTTGLQVLEDTEIPASDDIDEVHNSFPIAV